MEDIKNISIDFLRGTKERLSNPLVNSFVISWIFWNHKILLVIFSSENPWEKIFYLSTNVEKNNFEYIINVFLIPLATSLIWIFAMPFVSRFIIKWSAKQKNLTDKAIKGINEEIVLTKEEAIKLREKLADQWEKISLAKEKNSRAIEEASNENIELKSRISVAESEKNSILKNLDDLEKEKQELLVNISNIENIANPNPYILDKLNFSNDEEKKEILRDLGFTSYGGDIIDFYLVKNKLFNTPYPLHFKKELRYKDSIIIGKDFIISDHLIMGFLMFPKTTSDRDFSKIKNKMDFSRNNYLILCRDLVKYGFLEYVFDNNEKILMVTDKMIIAGNFFMEMNFELNYEYSFNLEKHFDK